MASGPHPLLAATFPHYFGLHIRTGADPVPTPEEGVVTTWSWEPLDSTGKESAMFEDFLQVSLDKDL